MVLDSLEERLMRGDVPAFLYTIPFFHNPTGAVMSSDRCKRLSGLHRIMGSISFPMIRIICFI
ncbi:hypothetical protein PsorP6_001203 [Peronosclerospora sorghi]|uniref:Uncharacterized protein n=1 Tax=Peronosclerospora sorghi TaxID=230839 RepID=A0ACC0WXN7_9STRA|nr:hypothetical protein PsorP6_001203 [Peronosclerospora sorghi]